MAKYKNEFPKLRRNWQMTKARRLLEAIRHATHPGEAVQLMGIVKKIARDEHARPEVRLKAIEIYLDRTIGKPEQNANQDYMDQLKMQMAELELIQSRIEVHEKLQDQLGRDQDGRAGIGGPDCIDAVPSLPPPAAEEEPA